MGTTAQGIPSHAPSWPCSAVGDAAGLSLSPTARVTVPPQPRPSRCSILQPCSAPHQPERSPCSAGVEMGPPSLGRDPPPGWHSPIGGVASVCRPTSWPGPSPSRKSLNWLSAPSRVVGKMNLPRGEQRAVVEHQGLQQDALGAQGGCPAPVPPVPPPVPYVPSELLLLVLPSVDSRLPCRVTLVLISTAMPVSVLLRMLLRSFLGPASGSRDGE